MDTHTTENKTAVTSQLLCRLHRWRHRRGWSGGREAKQCGFRRRVAQREKLKIGPSIIKVREGKHRLPKKWAQFKCWLRKISLALLWYAEVAHRFGELKVMWLCHAKKAFKQDKGEDRERKGNDESKTGKKRQTGRATRRLKANRKWQALESDVCQLEGKREFCLFFLHMRKHVIMALSPDVSSQPRRGCRWCNGLYKSHSGGPHFNQIF